MTLHQVTDYENNNKYMKNPKFQYKTQDESVEAI